MKLIVPSEPTIACPVAWKAGGGVTVMVGGDVYPEPPLVSWTWTCWLVTTAIAVAWVPLVVLGGEMVTVGTTV